MPRGINKMQNKIVFFAFILFIISTFAKLK
jgi:hypothetical protein